MQNDDAMTQIRIHEAVCAERFKFIQEKIGLQSKILMWAGSALILALCSVSFTLLMYVIQKH
jgi:hypothetical protein